MFELYNSNIPQKNKIQTITIRIQAGAKNGLLKSNNFTRYFHILHQFWRQLYMIQHLHHYSHHFLYQGLHKSDHAEKLQCDQPSQILVAYCD